MSKRTGDRRSEHGCDACVTACMTFAVAKLRNQAYACIKHVNATEVQADVVTRQVIQTSYDFIALQPQCT